MKHAASNGDRQPSQADLARLTTLVLLIGLLLSAIMVARSQVGGDQLNMLSRAWLWVAEGELVPYGLPTSAGGKAPGGLTSYVVGVPLRLWQHHRAPTLLLFGAHLLGYLLLDRMIGRELGGVGRLLFAILYWLNPWRMYHSGFLWNPSFMVPLGALHMWTIYRQRDRPRFWESFLQVLTIGLAAQLHTSVVTLVLLSLVLCWRGYFRFHWPGVIVATIAVAASLIPWAQAVLQDPSILPSGSSSHARLGQAALSVARGLGYWLRYPAMIASSTILCLDFDGLPTVLTADRLRQLVQVLVGVLTLPVVLWANFRMWRHSTLWWRRLPSGAPYREWLGGVVRWSLGVTLLACLLTPTSVMNWQLLTVLHLAVLPVLLLGTDLLDQGRLAEVKTGAILFSVLSLGLIVAITWGSPMFRCGGETCGSKNANKHALRSDHVMLDELGINATCKVEVNQPGGWWPDVLPEN
jgi:hypothetical protein